MSRPRLEPARRRRTHFVGRDAELTLLGREIGRALSGEGGILLVRGEAGVGKTWLVEEALARRGAPGRSLLLRRARCSDSVGTSGVLHLIAQRVEACDPSVRLLLLLAAVIGRDFPLALAQRLARRVLGEADVESSAIDRAIGAHLLEPAETPGHFRFVHGLVADALRRGAPVQQLAALHGQLGELLAEQPELRVGGIAEVARHLAKATATLPSFAPRAAAFSRWAGGQASLQQQHDLAADHYRAALDALASIGEASGAAALERAVLLVSLGYSLALASPQDAEAVLDEAEALAEAHLHGRQRDRAARALGLAKVVRAQERCPATAEDCRREAARADAALAALRPGDERLRAQILAAYAPLLAFEPDRERPATLAREALRVARATDDPLALGAALEAVHWSLIDDPSVEERLAVASQVLAHEEARPAPVLPQGDPELPADQMAKPLGDRPTS